MNFSQGRWLYQIRRMFRVIIRLIYALDNRLSEKMFANQELLTRQYNENAIRISRLYNMATQPDEHYYRDQYWHWIKSFLDQVCCNWNRNPGRIVDLGCGQGRLTIPTAKWAKKFNGTMVVGVDLSSSAVEFAEKYAASEGLKGTTEFFTDDILHWLKNQASYSANVIVCTEVLYTIDSYKDILHQIARILTPGGIFIGAFRSRFYNLLHAVESRTWTALPIVAANSEGYPWGPPTKFSWFDTKTLNELLSDIGFESIEQKGIGICSGTEGDPLANLVRPSSLMQDEQKQLMATELAMAGPLADCGRYILAMGVKGKKDQFGNR